MKRDSILISHMSNGMFVALLASFNRAIGTLARSDMLLEALQGSAPKAIYLKDAETLSEASLALAENC